MLMFSNKMAELSSAKAGGPSHWERQCDGRGQAHRYRLVEHQVICSLTVDGGLWIEIWADGWWLLHLSPSITAIQLGCSRFNHSILSKRHANVLCMRGHLLSLPTQLLMYLFLFLCFCIGCSSCCSLKSNLGKLSQHLQDVGPNLLQGPFSVRENATASYYPNSPVPCKWRIKLAVCWQAAEV